MSEPSGKPTVVKEIGGFRLIRQLGEGGMGKVFLAQQQSLSRRIALKVLPPEMAGDQEFVARFHREAQSAALFQHANVVNVINAGRDAACGVHFIAFEFVEGGSLEDLLKQQPQLSEDHALMITRGIAQALAYAESKGIVHRDVKPDNILLDREGNPKLADLGLAKQPKLETAQVTQTGMVLGTPLYMAPEQALGVDDLDIRADIYALGLCLWRMLSGKMPFDENNTNSSLQILTKHINEDLADVREWAPKVSEEAAQVVAWMAARERDDRYQSAKSVARDLDLVLAGQAPLGPVSKMDAMGETVSMPTGSLRASSSRRNRLAASGRQPPARRRLPVPLIGGVVVGALGIGVGLAVAFSGPRPAEVAASDPSAAAPTPAATPAPTPAPTASPAPRATEPPVERSVRVEPTLPAPPAVTPPPGPSSEPQPTATETPAPRPAPQPTRTAAPAPTDPAKALEQLRRTYFVDITGLRAAGSATLRAAELAQRPRLERSIQLAGQIVTGGDRTLFGRAITRLRQNEVDDPLPGALGASFGGWLLELERLNVILAAVEAQLGDASERRDARFKATLSRKLDREARAELEKPKLDNSRRARMKRMRNPNGEVERRVEQVQRGLQTSESRLRALFIYVAVLKGVVNAVDRWSEVHFLVHGFAKVAHKGLLMNEAVRRTAIGHALRRQVAELDSVVNRIARGRVRALAEARLLNPNPSPFLQARVVPIPKSEPLREGVLLVTHAPTKLQLGPEWLELEPGRVKAKGKKAVPFRPAVWGKRGMAFLIRTQPDEASVHLRTLGTLHPELEVFLDDPLRATHRIKLKGPGHAFAIAGSCGPPVTFGRNRNRGERPFKRGERRPFRKGRRFGR